VLNVLKSAVDAGSLSDAVWAKPLAAQLQTEFIEAARPSSLLGRLKDVRHVPFRVRAPRVTSSSFVGWAGEAASKPVSELKFAVAILGPAKITGIVLVSDELARSSNPSAESVIRADMIASINEFSDSQFVDPANSPTDAHPGSILSGVTPVESTGSTATAINADIGAVVNGMLAAGGELTSPIALMNPAMAVKVALLRDSSGAAFPGLTFSGGVLLGMPVLTSTSVRGDIIAILDQTELLLADDNGVAIDVSGEASVIMDSASGVSGPVTSLWQSNLVGIRTERSINWQPRDHPKAAAGYLVGIT
jgi:HK97 family phage major capsid protein